MAFRKSSRYWVLKPMIIGIGGVGVSIEVFRFARVGGETKSSAHSVSRLHPNRARTLVRELRHALDRSHLDRAVHDHRLVGVARQNGLVVGELPGQLAAKSAAVRRRGRRAWIVVGKLHGQRRHGSATAGTATSLIALLRDQRLLLARDARQSALAYFSMCARR